MKFGKAISKGASATSRAMGHPFAFLICCALVVIWAACGPAAHYSETWQLVINTSTTIVTFLMTFLLQNSQNRDGSALQAKLDELVRAMDGARNSFIGIETLGQDEIAAVKKTCTVS